VPDLKLHFLGRPAIEVDGEAVEIVNRKAVALLAYLAATGERHSRDVLATLLWPEHDQTRARANLRRSLWQLNRSPVAPALDADADSVGLAPEASSDVAALRRLLDGIERADEGDVAAVADLAEAAELYRGDLLADFHLPDTAEFESWVSALRERLRERLVAALSLLTERALAANQPQRGLRYARRQIEIDPLHEAAHRQLMTALAHGGRRAAALAQFEALRALLDDELGVEPAAETVELARLLREEGGGGGAAPSAADRADVGAAVDETATTVRGAAGVVPSPLPTAERDLPASPYRGLFAFREEDAPLFFGREGFAERLEEMVRTRSLVAVVGPSGSGKSSVVHAGLLARLRAEGRWRIATFRPGPRPFQALAEALLPHLETGLTATAQLVETHRLAAALSGGDLTLMDVVDRALRLHPDAARFALVGDQFEELYTLVADGGERSRFLDVLSEAVFDQQYRDDPRLALIPTLRADFLGRALRHRSFADALQGADVKLGPMTRAELGRAIERPAALRGAIFEPGLVGRILDDVGGEPGNLPLLEFALATLWERLLGGALTHEAYDAVGRVDGALARHADAVLERLDPDDRARVQRIFVQVVRPGEGTEDTRRLATRAELGDADWGLVRRLADARLLVTGRDPEGTETVEVVHEALIRGWERLRTWMEGDRAFRVWQERLRAAIRQWEASDRDGGALLRGVALTTAEGWLDERPEQLSEAEVAFVGAGVAQREAAEAERARQRRERERLRRRLTGVLGVGLTVAVVLVALAGLQWRDAARQRDAARLAVSRQLSAQAQALADERFDLAALLGVEAVRMVPSEGGEGALRAVLDDDAVPEEIRWIEGAGRNFNTVYSANGRFVAFLGELGTVIVDRLERSSRFVPAPPRLIGAEFSRVVNGVFGLSDDGTLLALPVIDGVTLVDLDAEEVQGIRGLGLPATLGPNQVDPTSPQLLFSADGATLAWYSDVGIVFWDLASGRTLSSLRFGDPIVVGGAALSPDGTLFAYPDGGRVIVREVDSSVAVTTLPSDFQWIWNVHFSADGGALALLSSDGGIEFWLGLEREGRAWFGGRERLWQRSGIHERIITGATLSADGRFGYSSDAGGDVAHWELATGRVLGRLRGLASTQGTGLTLLDDGATLVAQAILDAALAAPMQLDGHTDPLSDLRFLPSGELLSIDNGAVVHLWSVDGRSLASADLPTDTYPFGSRLSPDGATILVPLWADGEVVRVWSPPSEGGDPLHLDLALPGPTLPISQFAFTSDGSVVVGGGCHTGTFTQNRGACSAGGLWRWDPHSGDPIGSPIVGHDQPVAAVAIAADGGRVASVGFDSTVRLWDANSGEQLAEAAAQIFSDELLPDVDLALTPDGSTLLLTAGNRVRILRWDGEALVERVGPERQPGGRATAVTVSPDGRLAAAGDTSGGVVVWELETGAVVLRDDGSNEAITALRFSSDGALLASGGQRGGIALHEVRAGATAASEALSPIERACALAGRDLSAAEWARYFGDEPYRATCSDPS
jgi:DNA-binding SARP family transcriptional activator/WD40 repeat protein